MFIWYLFIWDIYLQKFTNANTRNSYITIDANGEVLME